MTPADLIGWLSSLVLIATIAKQVHKQWKEGSTAGVSRWLFLGQISASIGFTIYSALLRNWVFVFTNAVLFCNALVGQLILLRNQRQKRHERSEPAKTEVEAF
jgi:MtN3 and saliva related transmembrane protein